MNIPNTNQYLKITFNRPSLRNDLKCWLINASIVNLSNENIIVEKIFFDSESDETEYTDVTALKFQLAQKIREQIHQLLPTSLELQGGKSQIGIIAMPLSDVEQFATPQKNRCIARTNRGTFTFPLFRMQF